MADMQKKVSVQLSAEVSGFKRQLTQAAQAMKRLDKDFDRSSRDMRRAFDKTENAIGKDIDGIEKDFKNLSKDVTKSLKEIAKQRPEIEITADDQTDSVIREARRALQALDREDAIVDIEARDEATNILNDVRQLMNRLDGTRANPRVDVEGNADRELADIRGDLNRIDGERATPRVDVEGNADRELTEIRGLINRIDGLRANPRVAIEGSADNELNNLRGQLERLGSIRANPRVDVQVNGLRTIRNVRSMLQDLDGRNYSTSIRTSQTSSGTSGGSGFSSSSLSEIALDGASKSILSGVSGSSLLLLGATRKSTGATKDATSATKALDNELDDTQRVFGQVGDDIRRAFKSSSLSFDVKGGQAGSIRDLLRLIAQKKIEVEMEVDSDSATEAFDKVVRLQKLADRIQSEINISPLTGFEEANLKILVDDAELDAALDVIEEMKTSDAKIDVGPLESRLKPLKEAREDLKRLETGSNAVEQELNQATGEAKGLGGALGSAAEKGQGALENMAGNIPLIGGALTGIIGVLGRINPVAGVAAAAILGIGAAGTVAANETDNAVAKIRASLGETRDEAKKTMAEVKDAFKDGYGQSAQEATDAAIKVKQVLGDAFSGDELEAATKKALTLSEVFGFDFNESLRTVKTLMKSFGITSDQAFDMLTSGAQDGLDKNQDMLDTFNEYSPQFKAMGFEADDFYSILVSGSDAGAWSIDKIGDAIKEFTIRIKDGSDSTSEAMAELSKSTRQVWKNFLQGKATGEQVFNAVVKDLRKMDDQVEANQIGVALFGTQWEDLEYDVVTALNTGVKSLEEMEGATTQAGDAMRDTLGSMWAQIGRSMKAGLGEAFMPLLESLKEGTKALMNFGKMAKEFLSSPFMEGVKAVSGFLFALNPLIMKLNTIRVFGGAMTKAFNGMFEKPKAEVYDFTDVLDEETAKQLQSYIDLNKDITTQVALLGANQKAVTKADGKALLAIVSQSTDALLAEKQRYVDEMNSKTAKYLSESIVLESSKEAAVLLALEKNNKAKAERVQEGEDRIRHILATASKWNRNLKTSEVEEIDAIMAQRNENMVNYLTDGESKQKTILERMKNNATNLAIEEAAAVIQQSAKARDERISQAEAERDEKIAIARYLRDEQGVISQQESDRMIAEANRSYDAQVKGAEDTHNAVVGEVEKQTDASIEAVDKQTGEIQSMWDEVMAYIEEHGWAEAAAKGLETFFSTLSAGLAAADVGFLAMIFDPKAASERLAQVDWAGLFAENNAFEDASKEEGRRGGEATKTGYEEGVKTIPASGYGVGQASGEKFAEGVVTSGTSNYTAGKYTADELINGFISKDPLVQEQGAGAGRRYAAGVDSVKPTINSAGAFAGGELSEGFLYGTNGMPVAGSDAGNAAAEGARGTGTNNKDAGTSLGEQVLSGYKAGVSPMGRGGEDAGGKAAGGVSSKATDNRTAGNTLGTAAVGGFQSGANGMAKTGQSAGQAAVGGVSGKSNDASRAGNSVGKSVDTGFQRGASGIGNSASSSMQSASRSVSGSNVDLEAKLKAAAVKAAFTGLSIVVPKPILPAIKVAWNTIFGPDGKGKAVIPKFFATGGIVTGATNAIIGEAGSEAVVPLSNKSKMAPFAHAIANMMPEGTGNGGGETTVVVKPQDVHLNIDGREFAKATAKYTQEEQEQRSFRQSRLNGFA